MVLTCACRLTVASLLFVFVVHGAGVRRATYLCLDCTKNMDKNWNLSISFIIHVSFDHAWAEHYPKTLRYANKIIITLHTCARGKAIGLSLAA